MICFDMLSGLPLMGRDNAVAMRPRASVSAAFASLPYWWEEDALPQLLLLSTGKSNGKLRDAWSTYNKVLGAIPFVSVNVYSIQTFRDRRLSQAHLALDR